MQRPRARAKAKAEDTDGEGVTEEVGEVEVGEVEVGGALVAGAEAGTVKVLVLEGRKGVGEGKGSRRGSSRKVIPEPRGSAEVAAKEVPKEVPVQKALVVKEGASADRFRYTASACG
jgi:hypothetical protein